MVSLSDLKPGQCAHLISYGETALLYRRRLLSLGLTCGVKVRMIRVAPLGCPLQIEVRGTCLTLRKNEARLLRWGIIE